MKDDGALDQDDNDILAGGYWILFEHKETEFSDGLDLGCEKEELRMIIWFLS